MNTYNTVQARPSDRIHKSLLVEYELESNISNFSPNALIVIAKYNLMASLMLQSEQLQYIM